MNKKVDLRDIMSKKHKEFYRFAVGHHPTCQLSLKNKHRDGLMYFGMHQNIKAINNE